MSKLTQGTQVYFIDNTGSSPVVEEVECATALNPGGNPADQIEDTCLSSFERTYKPGLRTPGTASLTLNADPESDSHITLHAMSEMNPSPTTSWAVGWSDGTDAPTLDSNGEFDLPTTRTWFTFEGYVSDFPFDFQQNAVVTTDVSIQRSGGSTWQKKAAV